VHGDQTGAGPAERDGGTNLKKGKEENETLDDLEHWHNS
jgi:hypothetical protein